MQNNLSSPHKVESNENDLLEEVLKGLGKQQKKLPTKLFYDEKGSHLFDKICELNEYYLTRTENKILKTNIVEITDLIGPECLLIELGSGSSTKIRLLLDHLVDPSGYIPIDISEEHLSKSVNRLSQEYPYLRIIPVCADYTQEFELPNLDFNYRNEIIYYPGSTIGNFTPEQAQRFLNRISKLTLTDGGLLIGIDMKKDRNTLERAYNDEMNITAEFNLNVLNRLNKELQTDFNLNQWKHIAFYNDEHGRIEMHLSSNTDQRVHINGTSVNFKRNETILTEYSYKYSIEEFEELISDTYRLEKYWTDKDNLFAVLYFKDTHG